MTPNETRSMRALAALRMVWASAAWMVEIVNVNFESKCSIYVQHNLLTLFNCSPRLLLLLFRTFWNCSVLLLFTYRIVDRIGLAVTGSIGDRSEYCRRQSHKLDITHTHQVTNSVGQRQGSRVWTRRPSSSCQRKQCRRLRTACYSETFSSHAPRC